MNTLETTEPPFAMGMGGIPLVGIAEPNEFDVVCGRGGASLKHPGNLVYRRLVYMNKTYYTTSVKTEKLKISRAIVAAIRDRRGRFLERDGIEGTWYDIGDKKAIEKTSQALREGQPLLRQHMVEMGVGYLGPGFPVKAPPQPMNPVTVFQQHVAQQQLLAQQNILQQKLAQQNQQFAQQQIIQQQLLAQREMMAQQQVHATISSAAAMQEVQGRALHNNSMLQNHDIHELNMKQLHITAEETHTGFSDHMRTTGQAQHVLPTTITNFLDPSGQGTSNTGAASRTVGGSSENDSSYPGPAQVPQHQPSTDIIQDNLYASYPGSELLARATSDNNNWGRNNLVHDAHPGGSLDHRASLGQIEVQVQEAKDLVVNSEWERQPSYQARSQSIGLSTTTTTPPLDPNTGSHASRKMDRRRIFAKMKFSRPASGRLSRNRSDASAGVEDGMPDIHMVGSTFSLLSNLSSNHDMKMEDWGSFSYKAKEDYVLPGSRRSLMSGLSRISGSSDAPSIFSDLSKKFTNISMQSIPMSEVSSVEEGDHEDLDESLHIGSLATANAAHMQLED